MPLRLFTAINGTNGFSCLFTFTLWGTYSKCRGKELPTRMMRHFLYDCNCAAPRIPPPVRGEKGVSRRVLLLPFFLFVLVCVYVCACACLCASLCVCVWERASAPWSPPTSPPPPCRPTCPSFIFSSTLKALAVHRQCCSLCFAICARSFSARWASSDRNGTFCV